MVKTLVLDLDNTLVCVSDHDDDNLLQCVTKRPGLDKFLRDMSQVYEVVVFNWVSGQVVKDLRKLKREQESLMVWIDDNASLYLYHPKSGVPPFHGNPNDSILEALTPLLLKVESSQISIEDANKMFVSSVKQHKQTPRY
ncbi:mitochondrial import inner membrane translocase subunit TIM50-like [Selaginella moellendorffii]|uniref:mitochondrial import inner membrane translocase subunit TIM50-like n=1 Tax=Selaginella moellendorffii TaxID=88036 RepID=UPI000D1C496A|nr:mitochondrial import inner membrane translocase subunit TIM50-like [Selaginella moellendorffii]|eukprot:XP_024545446.1 mitochondrial import inner membrane translocase subunit TIM50-like [Selaginella moellendorffii]